MWIAFIPVLLWSVGSICSTRAARVFGAIATNRGRLLIGVVLLGAWTVLGPGVPAHGAAWRWLLISGAVGLGIGDLSMFAAFRRIGMQVTILMLFCLAVPVIGLVEWLWIGTP